MVVRVSSVSGIVMRSARKMGVWKLIVGFFLVCVVSWCWFLVSCGVRGCGVGGA